MGFRNETADLSAALKAGMEKGLSKAELKAMMKAYIDSGGKTPASPTEVLREPDEIATEGAARPQKDNKPIDGVGNAPLASPPDKLTASRKAVLFGSIGLIAIVGIFSTLGAFSSYRKQQDLQANGSVLRESTSKFVAGDKSAAKPAPAFQTPEQQLTERIKTYWLPEVKQWSASVTDDPATFRDAMAKMDLLNSYLADLPGMKLNAEQTKVVRAYTDVLGAKQASILPDMRKQYSKQLDAQLFRHDIRVSLHGAGNRTLRLTGPIFAKNANIADTQATLLEAATNLRFRRIEYRWNAQLSGTTYYDINPPSDSKVAATI